MELLLLLFGGLVAIVGSLILNGILRGWVLSYLWLWFAVPFGLPSLNITQAIGVALIAGFLTARISEHKTTDENKKEYLSLMFESVTYNLLALGIGYIVKGYL